MRRAGRYIVVSVPSYAIRTLIGVAVASCLLVACGQPNVAGSTATVLLKQLSQNATQAGWVHVSIQTVGAQSMSTYKEDVGPTSGQQDITVNGNHARVILVDNMAYVKADAPMLADYFGVPAAKVSRIANQWIAVPPSDPEYQTVTNGVTMASILDQTLPAGPVTETGGGKFEGVRQVTIQGALPAGSGPKPGTATLLVALGERPLPLSSAAQYGSSAGPLVTFSKWGVPVQLAAPAGAVPAPSIGL
jgi:hypothetical protein